MFLIQGYHMDPKVQGKIARTEKLTKAEAADYAPKTGKLYVNALKKWAAFESQIRFEQGLPEFKLQQFFTFSGPESETLKEPISWFEHLDTKDPSSSTIGISAFQLLCRTVRRESKRSENLVKFAVDDNGLPCSMKEAEARQNRFRDNLDRVLKDIEVEDYNTKNKKKAIGKRKEKVRQYEELDEQPKKTMLECIKIYHNNERQANLEKRMLQDYADKNKVHTPQEIDEMENDIMVYMYSTQGNRTEGLQKLTTQDLISAKENCNDPFKPVVRLDSNGEPPTGCKSNSNKLTSGTFHKVDNVWEYIANPDPTVNDPNDQHPDVDSPDFMKGLAVYVAILHFHKTCQYPLLVVWTGVSYLLCLMLDEFIQRTYQNEPWVNSPDRKLFCDRRGHSKFGYRNSHADFTHFDEITERIKTTPMDMRKSYATELFDCGLLCMAENERFGAQHGPQTAKQFYVNSKVAIKGAVEATTYYHHKAGVNTELAYNPQSMLHQSQIKRHKKVLKDVEDNLANKRVKAQEDFDSQVKPGRFIQLTTDLRMLIMQAIIQSKKDNLLITKRSSSLLDIFFVNPARRVFEDGAVLLRLIDLAPNTGVYKDLREALLNFVAASAAGTRNMGRFSNIMGVGITAVRSMEVHLVRLFLNSVQNLKYGSSDNARLLSLFRSISSKYHLSLKFNHHVMAFNYQVFDKSQELEIRKQSWEAVYAPRKNQLELDGILNLKQEEKQNSSIELPECSNLTDTGGSVLSTEAQSLNKETMLSRPFPSPIKDIITTRIAARKDEKYKCLYISLTMGGGKVMGLSRTSRNPSVTYDFFSSVRGKMFDSEVLETIAASGMKARSVIGLIGWWFDTGHPGRKYGKCGEKLTGLRSFVCLALGHEDKKHKCNPESYQIKLAEEKIWELFDKAHISSNSINVPNYRESDSQDIAMAKKNQVEQYFLSPHNMDKDAANQATEQASADKCDKLFLARAHEEFISEPGQPNRFNQRLAAEMKTDILVFGKEGNYEKDIGLKKRRVVELSSKVKSGSHSGPAESDISTQLNVKQQLPNPDKPLIKIERPDNLILENHPVMILVAVPTMLNQTKWNLRGQTLMIFLPLTETVAVLKTRIEVEVGIPPIKQHLLHGTILCKSPNSLALYNIKNCSLISLKLKARAARHMKK